MCRQKDWAGSDAASLGLQPSHTHAAREEGVGTKDGGYGGYDTHGIFLRVMMIIDMIKWRGWQIAADDTFLLPSKQALAENMQQQVRQEIL